MTTRGWLGLLASGMVVVFSVMCSMVFVGSSTTDAIQTLAPPPTADTAGGGTAVDPDVLEIQVLWILVAVTVVVLLLATMTIPGSSLGLSRADRRPSRQALLIAMMLGVLAGLVGWLSQLVVHGADIPDPNDTIFDNTPLVGAVASSFSAGIAEEILVLAAPLVLFERSGFTRWRIGRIPAGWLLVGLVLVTARLAFHLYRGWATVQFLPWAIAAVLAFYWTRALIAMITAHIAWDLMVLLLPKTALYSTSDAAWYPTVTLLAILGLAAMWMLVRRQELVSSYLSTTK